MSSLHVIATPPPFPSSLPSGFSVPTHPSACDPDLFNPSTHLALGTPEYIINLDFQKVAYPLAHPVDADKPFPGLAFTAPFRVLSDEGVRAFRAVAERQSKYCPQIKQSDERTPLSLRGLGYTSPFIRAYQRSSELDAHLSAMSLDPVCAHPMGLNYSQINVGAVGIDKPVDAWHFDSVDYVLVVILSDSEDMVGGELQVLMKPKDMAVATLEETKGALGEEVLMTVKYPGPGYGIFMQGSCMLHHVTPVVSAPNPRMSLINSYASRSLHLPDRTSGKVFLEGDPPHVAVGEYARHKAWRASENLRKVIDGMWGAGEGRFAREDLEAGASVATTTETFTKDDMLVLMKRAMAELEHGVAVLEGRRDDVVGFWDEKNKVFKREIKSLEGGRKSEMLVGKAKGKEVVYPLGATATATFRTNQHSGQ
ncbi:hypothetical protein HDU93_009624, partial [Gonapodya sp. JEL0774]